jgi:uncharacterized membrane protein YhaH (DUF805 family)
MGFSEAVRSGFSKYGDFSGRAARSEYWFWTLFILLLFAGLLVGMTIMESVLGKIGSVLFGVAIVIVALGIFVPSLAVTVRRLHDTNSSGWWYLLCLIPYAGGLILIVWFCFKGTTGDNRFGPDPLQGDVAEAFT